jgi:hypothetical protein
MRVENHAVMSAPPQVLNRRRMRVLSLLLLFLLLASIAAAQAPSSQPDAPGIAVIKMTWRMEGRNNSLDVDPLRGAEQLGQWQRAQQEAMQENVLRAEKNLPQLPIPQGAAPDPRRGAQPDPIGRRYYGASPGYIYEVRFRNTGLKTVRGLVWEYVLFDPDTQLELGRHSFTSKKSISPSKSKTLFGRTASRPAPVIRVVTAGNPSLPHYFEQVVIQRIVYDDGSVWKRTSN